MHPQINTKLRKFIPKPPDFTSQKTLHIQPTRQKSINNHFNFCNNFSTLYFFIIDTREIALLLFNFFLLCICYFTIYSSTKFQQPFKCYDISLSRKTSSFPNPNKLQIHKKGIKKLRISNNSSAHFY